ncbi:TPA: hypothetical protein IHD49_000192 [Escherichia coli]|nr:hypothetical protein [Escherichia coli]HAT7506962.1 hypothetical protein [Citrobacter braakii]
MQAGTNQCAS